MTNKNAPSHTTAHTRVSWKTLDSDLDRVSHAEHVARYVSRSFVTLGLGFVFVALAALWAALVMGDVPGSLVIVVASAFGAYLALNIGANDVSNNIGPAVGAKAISLFWALVIAAICEVAGALIAGREVVDTISNGIIPPDSFTSDSTLVVAMLAALLSSALWINLATYIGAPISTTHSIVGSVLGVGTVATGLYAIDWHTVMWITAGWVASPIIGGGLAAVTLWIVTILIANRTDKVGAAKVWVPVLIGVMAWAFSTYLLLIAFRHMLGLSLYQSIGFGVVVGAFFYTISYPYVQSRAIGMENRKKSVKALFHLPLIISAALLSFAHGANDVSNAIAPVAAIVQTMGYGTVDGAAVVPLWVMAIGAVGISVGLFFGRRLVTMVGEQITKLNAMRAYCVALATAVTVIIASALGLPVSSTHIAVGGIFGVGFMRETMEARRIAQTGQEDSHHYIATAERRRRKLIRRSHFMTIIAAWIVTVPMTALLAAVLFWVMSTVIG